MSKRSRNNRRKSKPKTQGTVGPNGPGKKKRVVSGQVMKQLRLGARVGNIENWQKQTIEHEGARARVIMDMTFAINALSRRLSYHDKLLVFDPDMLEFAQTNPDVPLTLQDLLDLLIPVPVVSMQDLDAERQKCIKEFHDEEERRRKEEEEQIKVAQEAVKSGKLTDKCPDCDKPYGKKACSPMHASVAAAMQARDKAPSKPNGATADSAEPADNVSPTTEQSDLEVSDASLPFCTHCGEDFSELAATPEDCPGCGLPAALEASAEQSDDAGGGVMPPEATPPQSATQGASA